ncbi:MAG: DUF1361 domain-containing protein [Ferruginibacter sp.]
MKILVSFTLFVVALIFCRILYSGNYGYIFLSWNLFLAWIPYKTSLYLSPEKINTNWRAAVLIAGWLLFFPNALYIITDLVHLEKKTNVPTWYDLVLLFSSAIAGLLMAFASLYNVEKFFIKKVGKPAAGKLMVFCLFIGSFGVYLGRFLRWNSWDVVANPLILVKEIAVRFAFPLENYRTWAITLLFTVLFSLLYFTIKWLMVYSKPFDEDEIVMN